MGPLGSPWPNNEDLGGESGGHQRCRQGVMTGNLRPHWRANYSPRKAMGATELGRDIREVCGMAAFCDDSCCCFLFARYSFLFVAKVNSKCMMMCVSHRIFHFEPDFWWPKVSLESP